MTSSSTPAYKLSEICAAGTFGTVCVARNLHNGKLQALKVLKQAHLHRPRVIARTKDEAAIMSRLVHPSVAKVEELIEIDGRPVVVMEWIRGVSLEHLIRHFPSGVPVAVAVELVRQAAEALDHAYRTPDAEGGTPMGIIHRDIKPSNMLMSVRGDLKVVDFGIAHGQFEGKEAKTLSMVLGARGYLAPERLDGHDDKPTCDVYSLGICLYELLTGKHIILSVHHTYHAEALEKNLQRLAPAGLSEEATDELRGIVADLCAYHEEQRPNHTQVVERLDGFLKTWNLEPDLPGWARQHVLPLFARRQKVPPVDHPAYPDLSFLDRTARNVPTPAPPDVDDTIRQFLARGDWPDHVSELELLLLENPHWSLAPFLEVLPDQVRPWWQFWGAEMPEARQILAVLRVLQRRPTADARRKVLALRRHPDPEVAQAAHAFLDLGDSPTA